MDRNQSLTWEFLVILGVVLVIISPIGEWLSSIVYEISVKHDVKLTFNPLTNPLSGIFHAPMIGGGSGGSGGGSGGTSLFNVPIVDSSGGAGTIQVVAHDAASAENNAHQGGNTPTGAASAV